MATKTKSKKKPASNLEKFLHKALTDVKFRRLVVANPKGALESLKIEPTPSLMKALAGLGKSTAAADIGHEGLLLFLSFALLPLIALPFALRLLSLTRGEECTRT